MEMMPNKIDKMRKGILSGSVLNLNGLLSLKSIRNNTKGSVMAADFESKEHMKNNNESKSHNTDLFFLR